MKFVFSKNPYLLPLNTPQDWCFFEDGANNEILDIVFNADHTVNIPERYLNQELTLKIVPTNVEGFSHIASNTVIGNLQTLFTKLHNLSTEITSTDGLVFDFAEPPPENYEYASCKIAWSTEMLDLQIQEVFFSAKDFEAGAWIIGVEPVFYTTESYTFYDGEEIFGPDSFVNGVYKYISREFFICITPINL